MSKHDRVKSGFLDTLFTRSTKRGHRGAYSTNGTRPISTNDNEFDNQDVEMRVLRMTVEEINKKFHEILDDMNIPKDKRDPLMSKSLEEKRDMLRMHYKGMEECVVKHNRADCCWSLQCFQNIRILLESNCRKLVWTALTEFTTINLGKPHSADRRPNSKLLDPSQLKAFHKTFFFSFDVIFLILFHASWLFLLFFLVFMRVRFFSKYFSTSNVGKEEINVDNGREEMKTNVMKSY